MSLRVALSVDLSTVCPSDGSDAQARADRGGLAVLEGLPHGCRVIVNVCGRRFPTPDAVSLLRTHAERLEIQVEVDGSGAGAWLSALYGLGVGA